MWQYFITFKEKYMVIALVISWIHRYILIENVILNGILNYFNSLKIPKHKSHKLTSVVMSQAAGIEARIPRLSR